VSHHAEATSLEIEVARLRHAGQRITITHDRAFEPLPASGLSTDTADIFLSSRSAIAEFMTGESHKGRFLTRRERSPSVDPLRRVLASTSERRSPLIRNLRSSPRGLQEASAANSNDEPRIRRSIAASIRLSAPADRTPRSPSRANAKLEIVKRLDVADRVARQPARRRQVQRQQIRQRFLSAENESGAGACGGGRRFPAPVRLTTGGSGRDPDQDKSTSQPTKVHEIAQANCQASSTNITSNSAIT